MIRINVAEVKARLARYLDSVQQGETVILCRRNVPIAELRPLPSRPRRERRVGIDRGMELPGSFFEPLPDALLTKFEAEHTLDASIEAGFDPLPHSQANRSRPRPRPASVGGKFGSTYFGSVCGANGQVCPVSIVHALFGTTLTESGANVRQLPCTKYPHGCCRQFSRKIYEDRNLNWLAQWKAAYGGTSPPIQGSVQRA